MLRLVHRIDFAKRNGKSPLRKIKQGYDGHSFALSDFDE